MNVLVQWARSTPQDWQTINPHANANAWRASPKKAKPPPGSQPSLNNTNGWINDINVQGLHFAGADAYVIEPLPDDTVQVTGIYEDVPAGREQAVVWTIQPLAPDPRFDGQLNTRQRCTLYLGPLAMADFGTAPVENTTVRPWSEWLRPDEALIRYGVLMTMQQFTAHINRQTVRGWQDW